ncbi:hypothetical protein [Nocardia sp. N2S4-5]|uniref:Rv0361 family membrane protein n=1 Tax=Nocardia sp. N2S4-5 TaxID=3351565 RepID=UPI0037CE220B
MQQPGDQATEKIRTGGAAQSGDRVVSSGAGPAPVTRPPATPRPGSGPKNPVPQGPSGPGQSPPAEQGRPGARAAKPRQGSAPSPADIQPTMPAQPLPPRPAQPQQQRPVAPPQHVPPAAPPASAPGAPGNNRKRWLIAAGAAAVVLVVVLVAAIVGLSGGGTDNSPEGRVKAAVSEYADALDSGDLTELRAATCGPLHDFYQNIAPDQFAGVHKLSVDQKKVPRVDSVDSVEITGDKAVAQAGVYTDADPNSRTARTFDLQQTPDGWKVCDPPNAG